MNTASPTTSSCSFGRYTLLRHLIAICMGFFLVYGTMAQPVISNPSFESDTFTVFPGYVSGNGPITGWGSLGNHGINPGGGSPFADNGVIPDGTHVAFMQGDGAMTQTISGFVVGQTYQIQFFENARNGNTPSLEVTMDGATIVATHVVNSVGGANPYVQVSSDPFVAGATDMELAFVKSGPVGQDTTLLIDGVSFLDSSTPPSITTQPQSQVVGVGSTATFSVEAFGSAPFTYQWFLDGVAITGASGATLSVLANGLAEAGLYTVSVSNSAGSATSDPAVLSVRATIPGLFNTGVDASGAALADNSVDPHYTLIVNADSVSTDALVQDSTAFPIVAGPWLANSGGAKWIGPRFDTAGAAGQALNGGLYTYRTTFDLTGLDLDSVEIQGGWAMDNDGVSLSVNGVPTGFTAAGFGGLTPFTLTSANAALVDGVNTLDFEISNADVTAGYTGLYVDGLRGFATLPGTPPSIEVQPQGGAFALGAQVTLSVEVSGSQPFTYQWRKGGADLSGETNATLVLNGLVAGDAGDYDVVVSNVGGTVTSALASIGAFTAVEGLFNTGVDSFGDVLGDGGIDPNYVLIVNPDGASSDAIVQDSSVFPIVTGPWLANSASSKWIGPRLETSAAAGAEGDGGNYTYRQTFNLVGVEPASVTLTGDWTSDNGGVDILLNGVSTGNTQDGSFGLLHPFSITGLKAGVNTLDFVVNNLAAGYTGLRVDGIRALGDALPASTAPFITAQPQSDSKFVTEIATFSVDANGSAPLTYQWAKDGIALAGETGPVLSFEVFSPSDAGSYTVEITNPFGALVSDPATLGVSAAPSVTTQPQDTVVAENGTAVFTVSAVGEPPLAYQWMKDGSPIVGAELETLTLLNVSAADEGVYSVQVFNFGGEVFSDGARLDVAQQIPGLFNTGVGADTVPLAEGAVDPHYTLIQSADPAYPGPDAIVIIDQGFRFPPLAHCFLS